ncbi:MAG: hypothetical protein ABL859_09215 [Methylotenera sp.]
MFGEQILAIPVCVVDGFGADTRGVALAQPVIVAEGCIADPARGRRAAGAAERLRRIGDGFDHRLRRQRFAAVEAGGALHIRLQIHRRTRAR